MVIWTVWAMCVVWHFRLCDQDRKPLNVGPLQKKFVWHSGLTKMLCAVWRNLNIFLSFLTLQLRQIYKKNRGCVDVGRTTFCMFTTRFMSHNLVVQSYMNKLLSVWMHLNAANLWSTFIMYKYQRCEKSTKIQFLTVRSLSIFHVTYPMKIRNFEVLRYLIIISRLPGVSEFYNFEYYHDYIIWICVMRKHQNFLF